MSFLTTSVLRQLWSPNPQVLLPLTLVPSVLPDGTSSAEGAGVPEADRLGVGRSGKPKSLQQGLGRTTAHIETEGTLRRPKGQRCKKTQLTTQTPCSVQGGEDRRLPIPVGREEEDSRKMGVSQKG